MRHRAPTNLLRQSLSSLAAMFVLLAPLAPTLHLVGSAHHLCHEHGEVEHGAVAHSVAPALHSENAGRGMITAADQGHAHERCDALATLKGARPALVPVTLSARLVPSPPIPAIRCSPRSGPTLLSLAPKTSPPVV